MDVWETLKDCGFDFRAERLSSYPVDYKSKLNQIKDENMREIAIAYVNKYY